MLTRTQTLPTVMICLDLGAALVYLFAGNVRAAVYWAAAAVLTASVTF